MTDRPGPPPAPAPGPVRSALARRFGRDNTSKAAVADAHTLIWIAWAVMSQDQDYTDAGEDYYEQRDERNRDHLIRHHEQGLARLGYQVTLTGPGDGSPPPGTPPRPPQPPARPPEP